MTGNEARLGSLIDHASQWGDIDYDEIAPTVEALTGSGDVGLVPRLREALVDVAGDDRAFAILAGALHDPDELVRREAIGRLGASGRLDAVEVLTNAVTEGRPLEGARIAYALGRLGRSSATPMLLQLLFDEDERVRDQARDALGAVGSPAAVDALLAEAGGPDVRRRAGAAKALAKAVAADPAAPRRGSRGERPAGRGHSAHEGAALVRVTWVGWIWPSMAKGELSTARQKGRSRVRSTRSVGGAVA
ncbi:HEAT repeat domain-containing protein [Actinoplanes sp. NPDC049596]|uniref:HEAT repeat domain-containing protein n=1 Tax=unclassified Actinoplanes TaxID=2626549 RepID=UPI0034451D24